MSLCNKYFCSFFCIICKSSISPMCFFLQLSFITHVEVLSWAYQRPQAGCNSLECLQGCDVQEQVPSPKLTGHPWNWAGPQKETIVLQPSIFRCESVSFREATGYQLDKFHHNLLYLFQPRSAMKLGKLQGNCEGGSVLLRLHYSLPTASRCIKMLFKKRSTEIFPLTGRNSGQQVHFLSKKSPTVGPFLNAP